MKQIWSLILPVNKNILLRSGILLFTILFGIIFIMSSFVRVESRNQPETAVYLPIINNHMRNASPPDGVVTSIELAGALCSYDINANSHSGDIYVTNERSNNVSVLRNQALVGNIITGEWPIYARSDPFSDLTYITNVVSGITLVNGGEISGQIPPYHESYYILINPINGYTYITDLHRPITVLQGSEKVMDLFVPDFEGHTIEWQLTADYDWLTGLNYFASWDNGVITVVDGLEVVDQFPYYGEGGKDMVVDAQRRFIYVANFRAGEDDATENNVSVIDMDTKGVLLVFTSQQSRHIALDHTNRICVRDQSQR